jgi:hypothetical protein
VGIFMTELVDLIGFLSDSRDEVKGVAVGYLLSFTNQAKLKPFICVHAILPLWKLRNNNSSKVSHDALVCLVNLTSDKPGCLSFLNALSNDGIKYSDLLISYVKCDSFHVLQIFIDAISDETNGLRSLYCAILSNITRYPETLVRLFPTDGVNTAGTSNENIILPWEAEVYILKLVNAFFVSSCVSNNNEDPLKYISTVLMNISQLPETRTVLLQRQKRPCDGVLNPPMLLSCLLPFIHHPDISKRGGIIGTIRNMLIERDEHDRILGAIFEKDNINISKENIIQSPGCDILEHLLLCILNTDPEEAKYRKEELENIPESFVQ